MTVPGVLAEASTVRQITRPRNYVQRFGRRHIRTTEASVGQKFVEHVEINHKASVVDFTGKNK